MARRLIHFAQCKYDVLKEKIRWISGVANEKDVPRVLADAMRRGVYATGL